MRRSLSRFADSAGGAEITDSQQLAFERVHLQTYPSCCKALQNNHLCSTFSFGPCHRLTSAIRANYGQTHRIDDPVYRLEGLVDGRTYPGAKDSGLPIHIECPPQF